MPKKWEDMKEMCERTGFAAQTIYNRRMTGDGPPAYKVGGKLLFDPDETDAWIAAHAETPQPAALRTVLGLDVVVGGEPGATAS